MTGDGVMIVAVGPRDGLQDDPGDLSGGQKVDLVQRTCDACWVR